MLSANGRISARGIEDRFAGTRVVRVGVNPEREPATWTGNESQRREPMA